jgi:hypothetical protein
VKEVSVAFKTAATTKIGYIHYKATQHKKSLLSLLINDFANEVAFSFMYRCVQTGEEVVALVPLL